MITGLTRVRNEELIIEDTLRHFLQFCDEIILFDDASTDRTVEIAKRFEKVFVIQQHKWLTDREHEETRHRAVLLNAAKQRRADWCLYFDADERLVGPLPRVKEFVLFDAYAFQLFDGYMTPETNAEYSGGNLTDLPRMWGPECRWITMLFRAECAQYRGLDQREPVITGHMFVSEVKVRHFGKCISKAQYHETCDYYANHFPKYSEKWKQRKLDGHLRYDKSDFGRPLYTWNDLMLLPSHPTL